MTGTLLDRHLGTASLVVTLAGQAIALDQLGAVSITYGRQKPDGQPEPATCSLTTDSALLPTVGQVLTVELGADAQLRWPGAPVRRFTGRVTDAKVVPGPGTNDRRRRVQLVATGPKAVLGRRMVGDVPWPQELDGARISRLLAMDPGVTAGPIDTGTVQVLARDVDRQPLLGLLDQVATDAEGLLIELRDGRLVYHDADHRTAAVEDLTLTAGQVLWPLAWVQDLSGMVNDLTVGYGAAEPQAEVRLTDPPSIATHGLYAAKVSTRLADQAAAERFVNLTVARRARPWWDVSTMAVELVRGLDPATAAKVLGLEVASLVRVTGFPTDGPMQLGRLWVEGWTETITADSWTVVLSVSPYGRTGPPARWVDLASTISWAELDPGLSWAGAAAMDPGRSPGTTWATTAHDLSWADLSPTETWATWPPD